ncbi:MAG: T9SS type A sorting domain-containing protein [Paludibacter sp.]|nr:T9SS type A sorting domain-containing protein [Paludibacter sp.]
MKKITRNLFVAGLMFISAPFTMNAQPTTSAPTPPARSAAKVISIFSDAYNSVTGTDFNPNWGQSTVVSTIQIGADNILKYANLNYQGTQLSGSVNALPMDKLHIDVWTSDGTTFQITPISTGPKEYLVTLTPLNQNEWNSYDIDLSQFSGVDMSDVFQFKAVGNGTVYIDNLYFYDSSTTVDNEAPTAFTASAGTIASDGIELLLNATDNSGAVNYTISYGTEPTTVTVGGVSGTQKSYTVSGLQSGTAYTFSITAKDPTGNEASNSPLTVNATTLAALPAAPTPALSEDKVISIYSDAYTNVSGTNFYPGWGQTTVASEVALSGNNAMKYSNFNYQGIELGSHVDASGMTKVHIDIYPTTETSVRLTPISQTPTTQELPTSLGTLIADQWNSFDIPLSTYTNVVMSDIFQFKLDGGTGNTFYMDNLYFFNDTATSVKDVSEDQNVKCYINNAGQLVINSSAKITSVVIRNLLGQSLKSVKTNSSELMLNLGNITSGHYLVTFENIDGLTITRKVVKL